MGWNAPWDLAAGTNLQVVANGPQPDLINALAERDFVFSWLTGGTPAAPSYYSTWPDGHVGGQILDASFWFSVHALFDDEYSVWIDEHTTFPRDSTQWNYTPANLCAAVGVPIADTIGLDTFGGPAQGVSGNLLFMGWPRRYRSWINVDPAAPGPAPYTRVIPDFQLVLPADNNQIQVNEKVYDYGRTNCIWKYNGGTSFTNLGPWSGTVQPTLVSDSGSFSAGVWFWFPSHGGGSMFVIQFVADWNLLKHAYHHLRWLEGTASVDTSDPNYDTNDTGSAVSGTSQADAESNAGGVWNANHGTTGSFSGTIYAVAGNYYDSVNTPTIWQTHYGGNYGRVKGTGSDPYFSIVVDVYVYPEKCVQDEGLDVHGNVLDAYNSFDDNGAGLTMNIWQVKGTAGPAVAVTAYTPYMGKAAINDFPDNAGAGPYAPGSTSTNNGFMIGVPAFPFANYDGTSLPDIAAIVKYDVVGGFTKP